MHIKLVQNIINKIRGKNTQRYKYVSKNESNRDNWIIDKLKNIPENKKILDAGAGEMPYKKYCTHLKYISQDYCQYKGSAEGNKTEGLLNETWDTKNIDIVSDIISIPQESGTFDAILCSEVFEHIPYPIKAVKEFSRLLKKDGELIITAPFCCLTHQTPYYFYSGYSTYWYKKILEENDFEIIEMQANGNFFEYLLQEINRLPSCHNKFVKNNDMDIPRDAISEVSEYIDFCSKNQKKSEDILCFGWHVLAKKK